MIDKWGQTGGTLDEAFGRAVSLDFHRLRPDDVEALLDGADRPRIRSARGDGAAIAPLNVLLAENGREGVAAAPAGSQPVSGYAPTYFPGTANASEATRRTVSRFSR